jgi:predicted nucleic acid-binding protein
MPAEFDTNILVYAYDRTAGSKFDRSRELMENLWDTGEGVVSTQVLEEFYVTVTAKIPNRLKPREARQIVSDLGTWTVAVLEIRDILAGTEIAERYRLSFWDGLILAAAHKEEAATLWSEDFNHGQTYGEITVTIRSCASADGPLLASPGISNGRSHISNSKSPAGLR